MTAAQSRNERRSLEELDPDPIRVLEVDFGSLGVLRRYGGLRSFSRQFTGGFPNICAGERELVPLPTLPVGKKGPAALGVPVHLAFFARARPRRLPALAPVPR